MAGPWEEGWSRASLFLQAAGAVAAAPTAAAAAAQATPPLKILLLHGFGQDVGSMLRATARLRAAAPPECEFSICEAPHPAAAVLPFGGGDGNDGGGAQWWNMVPAARGAGWAVSLEHLVEALEAERFDGVVGFSQGAAALAMLMAEQQLQGTRWFQFACFIAGFPPSAPFMAERLDKAFAGGPAAGIPTWHAFGRDDFVIPPAKSEALARRLGGETAVLAPHAGGHEVPTGRDTRRSFRAFLDNMAAAGGRSR